MPVLTDPSGTYRAEFVPERGMNLISFRKGELEAIDQATRPMFDERSAGLGALIGPHFHHRRVLPPAAEALAKEGKEPFSHGMGRYAAWTCEQTEHSFSATLKGSDELNGTPLKKLEGQDFTMHYTGELTEEGLTLELAILSDTDSVVGFHTYYALAGGNGTVRARVQNEYRRHEELQPIPETWTFDDQQNLVFPITAESEVDFGFFPFPDPLSSTIQLETADHTLTLTYSSPSQENSFQLYHPKDASFLCIEPLSAKNPRKPILSVTSLRLHLSLS